MICHNGHTITISLSALPGIDVRRHDGPCAVLGVRAHRAYRAAERSGTRVR